MARSLKAFRSIAAILGLLFWAEVAPGEESALMVRIAEVEIVAGHVEDYLAILKEEAQASVALEPGVISIFPMYEKSTPTKVRILEIYANREAYEAHLKTPHFMKYKTTTLEMVKSLVLVDMHAIDAKTMADIFTKARAGKKQGKS